MNTTTKKPLIDFDRENFLCAFSGAIEKLDTSYQLGKRMAARDFKRVFFTGCGAPHYMMRSLAYWVRKFNATLDVRNYFSAELVHQDPTALDEDTLVILGSHSGKTAETVSAAEFLKTRPSVSLAITQFPDSPLAKKTDELIAYGETKEGYFSSLMLALSFMSAFLDEVEPNWLLDNEIAASLPHIPEALADAKQANLLEAAKQAQLFSQDKFMYVIGGGPMFTTAYTFASCFLMEMQRMHAHPIEAAEFFHGPFEVVDKETPIIVLVGEGPSRVEEERVVRFCQKYAKRFIVMDSKDYQMKNIAESVRPLIAPFIVDAALTALVESLAVVHDFPLTIRRYMGKVEY